MPMPIYVGDGCLASEGVTAAQKIFVATLIIKITLLYSDSLTRASIFFS